MKKQSKRTNVKNLTKSIKWYKKSCLNFKARSEIVLKYFTNEIERLKKGREF